MRIYGNHFEYAGQTSRKYGLIFATVESNHDYSMSGKTDSISVYNDIDKKKRFVSDVYEDAALQFEAEVVCEKAIPVSTQREIQKWLFRQNGYKKLYFDIADDCLAEYSELVDGELKRTYLNCRFTNPSRLEYFDGVVGYRFTVECDSIMGWQDPITKIYRLDTSPAEITLQVDTDIEDYVYPSVSIVTGRSGGDIQIVNNADDPDRSTSFVGAIPGTIVMKPSVGYVTDEYYDSFSDKNFVRLLNGDNTLVISGDVSQLEITWQNARYV